jgi:outer membrane murein-binding lipoprotein Lpp
VAVKPISEWTDDDLQSHVHPYYHTKVNALAAEVLRLREEVDRQQRNTMEALAEADEYSAELDRTVIQLEKTMARETEVVVRAEKAEAERDQLAATVIGLERSSERLIAERNARQGQVDSADARAERAEALCDAVVQTYETRLARVRELVDEADGEPKRLFWPSEILAAIEGDNQ